MKRSRFLWVGALVLGLSRAVFAGEPVAAGDGALLFRKACAMCHGSEGRADTPMARNLGVKDLTHSVLSEDDVRARIRMGVRGHKGAMPAFAAKFSEAELEALIAHVMSLRISEKPAKS